MKNLEKFVGTYCKSLNGAVGLVTEIAIVSGRSCAIGTDKRGGKWNSVDPRPAKEHEMVGFGFGGEEVPAAPARGKKKGAFRWSFSAEQDYGNCPFATAHKRAYKTYTEPETEPLRYGNYVHKIFEDYLVGKIKAFPEDIKECQKYADHILATVKNFEAQGCKVNLRVEELFQLDKNLRPVTSWPKTWCSGKGDVMLDVTQPDGLKVCYIFDWKTGKVKLNSDQGELMALMGAKYTGFEADKYVYRFIFTKFDKVLPETGGIITKEQLPELWQKYFHRIKHFEDSWTNAPDYADETVVKHFPKRSSGLCRKHCSVLCCEHNGRS